LLLTLAGSTLLLAFVNRYSVGAAQKKKDPGQEAKKYQFYGVSSCVTCHRDSKIAAALKLPEGLVKYDEYETWKTRDRHSQAFAVLLGPRGQQIGRYLDIKVTDRKEGAMCLACHTTTFLPGHEGKEFSLKDGVSCDGCHGPAGRWFAPHTVPIIWRDKSPAEKAEMDMFNVRDAWKRAELCISCHVGSPAEGKVITHSMYAAGHPPLPSFELASFSKNLPPHWYDLTATRYFMNAKDAKIRKNYRLDTAKYQHTKLVLAGSVVVARKAMELLAARAEMGPLGERYGASISWPPPWFQDYFKHEDKKRWPELQIREKLTKTLTIEVPEKPAERWPEFAMAQSDCFACHHELKSPSWRQARGYAGRPGRPQFQAWALALAGLALNREEEKECRRMVKELQDAFDIRPFGAAVAVAAAAKKLAQFFEKKSNHEIIVDDKIARNCLARLASSGSLAQPERAYVDYDTARQIAWAFRAIFLDEWNAPHPHRQNILDILHELDRNLNLTLDAEVRNQCAKDRKELMQEKEVYESSMKDLLTGDRAAKFLAGLDKINEDELRGGLASVSKYDPAIFRKRLAELSEFVDGKDR